MPAYLTEAYTPRCADILTPLNALLKATSTNSHTLQWNSVATSSFQEIKDALVKATLLVHPKPEAPINVMTDASDVAIGAVLQQYLDGKWCPLSYFSRKLSPTEQRYSTFDCELLAVYCAIRHFQHFLEAREFHVLTDHKPLTHNFNSKPDRHSPQQVRQLDFISQFTIDIRHVTGRRNPVADALSHLEANIQLDQTLPTINFKTLAKAQPNDADMEKLQVKLQSSSTLQFQCPCAATPYFVTHQLGHHALLFLRTFAVQYLTLYTVYPTQVFELPNGWSPLALSGQGYI